MDFLKCCSKYKNRYCVIDTNFFFSDEKFAKPAGPDSKGTNKYGVGGMRLPVNCTEKREYFS